MNKFKISAIEVLRKEKKPLHYKEITRLALERGLLTTEGATPENSMNSQITTDIKTKGKDSSFQKISPSIYFLNPKLQNINFKNERKEAVEEEKIVIESGFTGKAGEHMVCSELLFRGFNASIMSVDVGMDIIATKNNQLIGIQVKTSNLNVYNTYVFDIRKVSFERHDTGSIFYIFVLHGEGKNNFLIMPYHEMEKKIKEKAIREVGQGNRYRVNIKTRDNNVYLGTKEHEVNYYLNNWNIIK